MVELTDPVTGAVLATTTTAADGSYSFTGLTSGAYIVVESDPTGYKSTTSNSVAVSLGSSGSATADFGDQAEGSVSGFVFDDVNGNGVQDPGEGGLAGVTVRLTDPVTGLDVLPPVTTTAGGYFEFTGVSAGPYVVRESDPLGYVSTTPNEVSVSVSSGGAATANFGDRLAGTVSGTVFDDRNSNGIQDADEPGLSGVTVHLIDPTTGLDVVAPVITSSSGAYEFTAVVAGNYLVREDDPSGYTSSTPNTVPVVVPAGGVATAQFGDLLSGRISGVVFSDVDGNSHQSAIEPGLPDVTVELIDASTGLVVATTTTASDGSYSFTGVAAGSYFVRETDPAGFASTTPNLVPVNLASGGAAGIDFGDQAASTVAGVVFNDVNGDGLQDPAEIGIGGVTVTLTDAGTGAVVATTVTAGNGSYVFSQVPPGAYIVVETDPAGFSSTTSNTVPVSVASGGVAVAHFGDRLAGTVSGFVFNDVTGEGTKQPFEGGLGGVLIQLVDPSDGSIVATTTTGADGSYVFHGVTPGTYVVRETDPSGFNSTTPNDVTIFLSSGGAASANFGDQAEGTVSGIVFVDLNGNGVLDSGEPGLGGVTVNLSGIGDAVTTANGTFLFTSVPAGNYTVTETDPSGYTSTTPNTVPVTVSSAGPATAQFGDRPAGVVSGRVFNDTNGNGIQDANEPGLSGVEVSLSGVGTVTTAADGSYVFTGVPPGSYTVTETDPTGFVSTTSNGVPINLGAGESASANFGDLADGTVSGVVFHDQNGNGVQDADEPGMGGLSVTLSGVGTVTTASDGSYLFSSVAAGSYDVTLTPPSGFTGTTPNPVSITLGSPGAETVNFGLEEAPPASTPTATPTNTPTSTPTITPTQTPTATPTNTPTLGPSATPTATPSPTSSPTPGTCGDGAVQVGEECDDGNLANLDGCSATCQSELIRGGCGGGHALDCYSEWLAQPVPVPDRLLVMAPSVTCQEGQAGCDFGPAGDQACDFRLSICLNVTEQRISCTPTNVAQVDLWLHARIPEHRDELVSAFTALGGMLAGRCHSGRPGLVCSLNADCDSAPGSGDGLCKGYSVKFTPPLTATDSCTDLATIRVPLRQTRVGFIRGFVALGLTTHPSNDPITGRRRMADRDILRLYCNP